MSQSFKFPTTSPSESLSSSVTSISANDNTLITGFSGDKEPTKTPGQFWVDTKNNTRLMRNGVDNNWITINPIINTNTPSLINSDYTLSKKDNGLIYEISGTNLNILLPKFLDMPLNYKVILYIITNSKITLSSPVAELFEYNGSNNNTAVDFENMTGLVLNIDSDSTNNKFIISGVFNGLNRDLSNISNAFKKAFIDAAHPVGTIINKTNDELPEDAGGLIKWEVITKDNVKVTKDATTADAETYRIGNPISSGSTGAHQITANDILNHVHAPGYLANSNSANPSVPYWSVSGQCQGGSVSSGSSQVGMFYTAGQGFEQMPLTSDNLPAPENPGQSHTHSLNFKNVKVISYRRTE
tara:strand:+ start:9634 stop:10701 length:1068 start_codon:yes stop_codon:yes gene_type:complete